MLRPAGAAAVRVGSPADRGREHKAESLRRRLSNGIEVEVYRVARPEGSFAALSAYLDRQELLRVDLIPDAPHVHYGLAQTRVLGAGSGRVAIQVGAPAELRERAGFELRCNLAYCLATHPSARLAALGLDDDELAAVARWAEEQLGRLQGPAQ